MRILFIDFFRRALRLFFVLGAPPSSNPRHAASSNIPSRRRAPLEPKPLRPSAEALAETGQRKPHFREPHIESASRWNLNFLIQGVDHQLCSVMVGCVGRAEGWSNIFRARSSSKLKSTAIPSPALQSVRRELH